MAKLNSYYTLCPLIDQQNLLGVERDSESGCAIVTLGRNIVIRYKLQDPKQLTSWSSKDRLTTRVIYDESTRKYAAIFNENKIRIWSEGESDLNDVKGHKFQQPLHAILTFAASAPVVVRQDGASASLEWALRNRRTWNDVAVLRADEKILDCALIRTNGKIGLYLLVRAEGKWHGCVVVRLDEKRCSAGPDHVRRIELKRRSEELVGHTIVRTASNAYLLSLWSHGRLYAHSLTETSSGEASDEDPSSLIGVIGNINTKHPVVMTPLNEATIAVYGADVSEEGAVLMIYNVQFKLVQASQKLKLYTRDAKLWKIEDKLLLAANRHLAIAPYQLAPQKIAALLGSSLRSKKKDEESTEDDEVVVIQESTIARWEEAATEIEEESNAKIPLRFGTVPPTLAKQISSYANEGSSDATIQEILIPQSIEAKDVVAIVWCLDTLKDLPEKLLVDLLVFALRTPDEIFQIPRNGVTNGETAEHALYARNEFLDKIFGLPYSDLSFSSYLRMALSFDETLRLLDYLIEKLDDHEESFDDAHRPTDRQLYEWSSLLLDSHYQRYILSRDPEVSQLIEKLNAVLEDHLQLFQDLENLRPILSRTIGGKSLKLSPRDRNKFYDIEEIKLY